MGSVPTLNLMGTHDEFFGPALKRCFKRGDYFKVGERRPAVDRSLYKGSITNHIVEDKANGWGDEPSGNAFESFRRQGIQNALVATFVGGTHDITEESDNSVRDVLIAFLNNPMRCTEAWNRIQLTDHLRLTTTLMAHEVRDNVEVLWIEIDPRTHGIDPKLPYMDFRREARLWARNKSHARGAVLGSLMHQQSSLARIPTVDVELVVSP